MKLLKFLLRALFARHRIDIRPALADLGKNAAHWLLATGAVKTGRKTGEMSRLEEVLWMGALWIGTIAVVDALVVVVWGRRFIWAFFFQR